MSINDFSLPDLILYAQLEQHDDAVSVLFDRVNRLGNADGIQELRAAAPQFEALFEAWDDQISASLDKAKFCVRIAELSILYRWDVMEQKDFKWWRERMKATAALYDVIRIDHFIGIVNYWSIPVKCKTAKGGKWCKGPGEKLTKVIDESVKGAKIIAEDLGVLTKPVKDLIAKCGYPGMKVLEFGVAGDSSNGYLMHNYTDPNCIAYIGTHDNETLAGFLAGREEWEIHWMMGYFGILKKEELHDQMIRKLYESIANVVIIQMQDFLHLDNSCRINHPATLGTNWQWRMLPGETARVDKAYYKWVCEMFSRVSTTD